MELNSSTVQNARVDTVELSLKFPRTLSLCEATHLRGFFGREFADEVMLHHHETEGKLRYAYPKVQFKVIDRTAHVLGFAEGAALVTRLWSEVDQTQIGTEVLPVLEAGLIRRRECLGKTEIPLLYRFRTPWLGLNQENHFLYEARSDATTRLALLERAMVGNCLSLAKGFRHWVEGRIIADCRGLKPVPAGLKGVAMVGFVGTFRVNFQIPDHAGIGKSVSRGFGTVERIFEPAGLHERRHMLIEDLIRQGRPLLDSEDFAPKDILRLITGVEDVRVKNFYQHVFVVLVPTEEGQTPRVLPMQQFGEFVRENGKEDFRVAVDQQAVGAPILLPSGGNPLQPQGRYVPIYPCYDPHIQAFRESDAGVKQFLTGRLERTVGFSLSENMVGAVASAVHEEVKATDFGDEKKVLGILILARCEPGGYFTLDPGHAAQQIGMTDGYSIVPNFRRILDEFWSAKLEEGKEAGSRTGACSFSGIEGDVVSAYCKAWPWAFPTWTCPLPHGGDERMMVESFALSAATYRALTLGACVFDRLTKPVDRLIVVPELFSPADTRVGKDQAKRRKDLTTIYGSAFLLPIQDQVLADLGLREDFVRGIRGMLEASRNDPTMADRYLTAVTGFDIMLPRDTNDKDYRLTLVYFSGEVSRGDVHLRAYIQDVIPSTLGSLRDLARDEARAAMQLLGALMPKMSEKQAAYYKTRYQSVPYLLARAYGGAYLWQQLEAVLHHKPLVPRRVIANAARRMQSLTPQWPDSRFDLYEEVGFYLSFLPFLGRVNRELAGRYEEPPMRPWKELLDTIDTKPVAEMQLTDPAEIGFACGALIKRFSGATTRR